MEIIKCNLCKQDNTKLLFKKKDYVSGVSQEEFTVVKCLNCGLAYVNPRPTEQEIAAFYTNQYYRADLDIQGILKEREKQLQAKYNIVKHFPPGKLLDIGCQKGEFMWFMKQRGWEVKGIEISPDIPNLFNLDIYYGRLSDAPFNQETFDLITLWAVLEHVYDPMEMLRQIKRLLKKGGHLVILVTNIESIAGRFLRFDDIPRHTTLFSKKTITQMLHQTNFKTNKFIFSNAIFSASIGGIIILLFKWLCGEKLDDIIEQKYDPARAFEFNYTLRGKKSQCMSLIRYIDKYSSKLLDYILCLSQKSGIFTVIAERVA